MLLGSFLSFGLVSFVYAQLLTQANMELEPEIISVTDPEPNDHMGSIPLDVEGYPVAPPALHLEQVHMFVRHGVFWRPSYLCRLSFCSGERTPVGIRMSEAPANIPSTWPLCHEGRRFEAAVASLVGSSTLRVERVVERGDGSSEFGEW
jgi:hypothetical protein